VGSIDRLEFFAVGIGHTTHAFLECSVYHKGHSVDQEVLPNAAPGLNAPAF
jgi:hypothetical protein